MQLDEDGLETILSGSKSLVLDTKAEKQNTLFDQHHLFHRAGIHSLF